MTTETEPTVEELEDEETDFETIFEEEYGTPEEYLPDANPL